jgi:tripartite-type tricarboxylate transporter receptor subunit TctC
MTSPRSFKFMLRTLAALAIVAGQGLPQAAAQSAAANYPNRPIRIVVPYTPGGGSDTLARMLAEKMQSKWGQPVIVDNRAGAGGNIGTEAVFRSAPDGYTLLFTPHPPLVVNKFLYRNLNFDPALFEPVSVMALAYSVLYANPKAHFSDLREFLAFTKANPGKVNYASQSPGTSSHLCMELLNTMADVKTVHVPYKGSAPAMLGVASGETDVVLGEVSTGGAFAASGRLRMIAVGGPKRLASAPNVPTIGEAVPGFTCMLWQGLVAPPGTPTAITKKLAEAITEVTRMPDIAKRMLDLNMLPGIATPEETAAFFKEERERWSTVIRTSGAKAD